MDLDFLKRLPVIGPFGSALLRARRLLRNPFVAVHPPGHFYSPIPDMNELRRHRGRIFDNQVTEIAGVDLNIGGQLATLDRFADFYGQIPFTNEKSSNLRYYYDNSFFRQGDAIALHCMLRSRPPGRVVEVGSGFSSAIMLDTNDVFLNARIQFTFIDPYPQRLRSLLGSNDQKTCRIIEDQVQNVPLETFTALQPGDILFIDSSHVAKTGSDVVHLLTHVLPTLKAGVLVHFHDIFWPFEYPEEWLERGRAWNENHILKAFLQFNSAFRIIFFNDYLATHHEKTIREKLPLFMEDSGGSLWLEKVL